MPRWTAVDFPPRWRFYLEAEGDALRRSAFGTGDRLPTGFEPQDRDDSDPLLRQAAAEMREYFQGKRQVFTVPFELDGTEFQCRVWEQLRRIPYGRTVSYAAIARSLGKPASASRAVGGANGSNPLPVIVPCHRVLESNGKLGGYGGGVDVKRALLELEGVLLAL